MTLASLAGSVLVRALAWALLHFLWQGVLIALALALVLAALSRAGASARYGAACVAMALMALAPAGTFWLLFTHLPGGASGGAGAFVTAGAPAAVSGPPVMLLLLGAWLAGAALMTARLVGGLLHLRGLVARHTVALADTWQETLDRLARELGVRRRVRLSGSARIDVPMAVGWLRPVVVVPLSVLTSLPEAYVVAILAHELAHVRRLDYLVNVLQSAVEAALFYHPCVWWVSRRIRDEREHCCDDAAVALLGDPLGYARALAELEAIRAEAPSLALASNGGSLMLRIKRIVTAQPSHASPRAWLAPALLVAGTLGLGAAGLSACGETDEQRPALEASTAAQAAPRDVDIPWLPASLARWKPAIVSTAVRYDVDPDALAIVALVESCGDPEAESEDGAVGLMQVMPATAARIARERGLADFSQDRLRDPAYNIDLGGFYFAQQLASFGGKGDAARSIELAAAAYNGGPKRVRAYLEGDKPLSEETERYKALVVSLWKERGAARSSAYDAWRQRVRLRTASRTASPLPGARVSLPFGKQPQPWTGEEYFHEGIDLAGAAGTPVMAPLDGTVKSAAADGDRGNVIVLDHGGGIQTRFHHLGDLTVAAGQKVGKGSVIGTVGSSGKVTGPHVHFEVRDNGEALDPAGYMDGGAGH